MLQMFHQSVDVSTIFFCGVLGCRNQSIPGTIKLYNFTPQHSNNALEIIITVNKTAPYPLAAHGLLTFTPRYLTILFYFIL